MLTEDQLIEEYGEGRLWPHYEDIIDRVDNIGRGGPVNNSSVFFKTKLFNQLIHVGI